MPGIDARQIVEAATVPSRENMVYCLGPFPRRVSFSAQQHRALNLVWALNKEAKFASTDRIAVVGAGLAGLTAAAAFIAHGCEVDVYESEADPLPRQRTTDHRMAHPTINRWPHVPLSITTQFPFMEWYANTCREVTALLEEQYNELSRGRKVRTRRTVLDIATVGTNAVRLDLDGDNADENDVTYRLVLIAVGFGAERATPDFEPDDYWHPDNLEILRGRKKRTDFIISGCGDGGLIDTLRLVHYNFKKGMLALDTAGWLTDTPVAEIIAHAENAALGNQNADNLATAYESAVEELIGTTHASYAPALDALDKSLAGTKGVVYLVDEKHRAPYSLNAAPIHKFMIRHAIRRGRVKFRQGSVKKTEDKIMAHDVGVHTDHARVVIRHGAELDFGRLISDDERELLRQKQSQLLDYHIDPAWTDEYPVPSFLPAHDFTSEAFRRHRKKWAVEALSKIASDAALQQTTTGYQVIFNGRVPPQAPRTLFGVPVELTLAEEVDAI